jgi:ATP-dependent Clp protease ATP-binding subunit ClpA
LTSGRGETVYFSESIIVFTSNKGVTKRLPDGSTVPVVEPGAPYEQVDTEIRKALTAFFTEELSRPELLNRLGDNIVVFGFIAPETAGKIFAGMLENVRARVRDEHGVELEIAEPVRDQLRAWCTADLSMGGRGIGSKLETTFINPLARALFEVDLSGRKAVTVSAVEDRDGLYSVTLA